MAFRCRYHRDVAAKTTAQDREYERNYATLTHDSPDYRGVCCSIAFSPYRYVMSLQRVQLEVSRSRPRKVRQVLRQHPAVDCSVRVGRSV